jgi:hypothetical protein
MGEAGRSSGAMPQPRLARISEIPSALCRLFIMANPTTENGYTSFPIPADLELKKTAGTAFQRRDSGS